MGKTRGHGSRRGAYRGRGGGGRGRGGEEEESSEEERYEQTRSLGGQRSNVGMLPPSDSDEEEGAEGAADGDGAGPSKAAAATAKKGGQSKNAGKLPPSDSEDEDEDSDEDESSSEEPLNEYLASSAPRKKKQVEEEPDPEQIRKDIERLQLIKEKREQDRLKRIAEEGWDRFAPISESNKPPGHVPSDHPSRE